MIPETIGRYEVQCLLGEGAFGQVFAARDSLLGRGVAIKLLRSMYGTDPLFMERFRAEAASLAALAHPNITLIYDVLQNEAQHGMVMELVHGHTLEHVLQQVQRLPLRETLAITAQTISGLAYIHRLGIVHRDIKPSNLMLTAAGVLKIMDFGIARMQGATRLTRDGSAVGTLAYAAPEQIRRGEGVPGSDQYSLACMIYEMLSGNPPFDAATEFELMQAQIGEVPKPVSERVPGVPAEVDQALTKALAKDPSQRFESVELFGRALGVDAIQREAVDIVRDVISRSDAIPPIPERVAARLAGPKHSSPQVVVGTPAAAKPAGGLQHSTPFMIMGAAIGVAAAVAVFVMLDSNTAQIPATPPPIAVAPPPVVTAPPQTAQALPPVAALPPPIDTKPPAPATPPQTTPLPQVEAAPSTGSAAANVPPPSREPFLLKPIDRVPEGSVPRPALDAPPALNDMASPRLESFAATPTEPPSSRPVQKPAQKTPTEPPVYRGKVEDWIGGNLLFVQSPTGGLKKLDLYLYGITDKGGSAKEAADTRQRLEAYAKGRIIKCWTRQEDNKQRNLCYLDNKDIALWALEQKLVKASKGAPPEYLNAQH